MSRDVRVGCLSSGLATLKGAGLYSFNSLLKNNAALRLYA